MHKFKVGDKVVVNRGSFQGRVGTISRLFDWVGNSFAVDIDYISYTYDGSWLDPAPVANEFVLSRSRAAEKGVVVRGSEVNFYFYDADDATKKLAKYETWARAAKAALKFFTDNPPNPKEDKLKVLEDKIKSQPNTRALAEMIYEMTKDSND